MFSIHACPGFAKLGTSPPWTLSHEGWLAIMFALCGFRPSRQSTAPIPPAEGIHDVDSHACGNPRYRENSSKLIKISSKPVKAKTIAYSDKNGRPSKLVKTRQNSSKPVKTRESPLKGNPRFVKTRRKRFVRPVQIRENWQKLGKRGQKKLGKSR